MNFGFLLFPDLEELDLVGPWEMVAMWGQYADGPVGLHGLVYFACLRPA